MRRMDRMSSLGQLSAGIAHEIRNPLSGINLNLQMLARQLKADPESTEKISDSLEGIVRINGLIKNVLNFARPTPPHFKWDFLQRVIKETLSIMASQLKRQKIRVIKKLPVAGPAIFFDENQMRQVFVNLLVNAMEAMPDGGTIKITGSVETNGSRLGLFRLIISDNGSGIPEDILSKIFDPFFTTKPEGTGLGLSILHQILEQHRAIIQVESSVGKGAVFTLSFPIRVDEAQNV
jgi:two-component system, NtrC family, sensor kinase